MLFSIDVPITDPIIVVTITGAVIAALIYGLLAFIMWCSIWKLIVAMCDEYIHDDVGYVWWLLWAWSGYSTVYPE